MSIYLTSMHTLGSSQLYLDDACLGALSQRLFTLKKAVELLGTSILVGPSTT